MVSFFWVFLDFGHIDGLYKVFGWIEKEMDWNCNSFSSPLYHIHYFFQCQVLLGWSFLWTKEIRLPRWLCYYSFFSPQCYYCYINHRNWHKVIFLNRKSLKTKGINTKYNNRIKKQTIIYFSDSNNLLDIAINADIPWYIQANPRRSTIFYFLLMDQYGYILQVCPTANSAKSLGKLEFNRWRWSTLTK